MVSTFDLTLFAALATIAIIIFIKYQYTGISSMHCGCGRHGCRCRSGCRCGRCPHCREGFGTSPGTLQQLAANHVPTQSDISSLREWWAETYNGIKQMTEFDEESNTPVANYAWPGFARVGAYS